MPDQVYIFDTTLRDGEQTPGVNLNRHEKIEIARLLESLGVDVIEAGFPIASPGDFDSVKAIAEALTEPTICGLSRAVKKDIDRAWEALQGAKKPRIHTFIATSDIHMQYKLKLKPEEVLEHITEAVSYARNLCPEVEFSPEDGTRTRPEFLAEAIRAAIKAGARIINLPDTVGYTTPHEFGIIIDGLYEHVPELHDCILSVHCHDDLGMAVANSLSAVRHGARQVECTLNGLGERAGNAALEEIVMAIRTRQDILTVNTGIDTTQLTHACQFASRLAGVPVQPNKAIIGANAFAHESGIHQHGMLSHRQTYEIMTPEMVGLKQSEIVLGKLSGRHAFVERLKELGYGDLSKEVIDEAFARFKDLADKKKVVLDQDIEALVQQEYTQIPDVYRLDYFHIVSGNTLLATATIRMEKNGEMVEEAACGDGPVDAIFNAINRATGHDVTLTEYRIRAITGGTDALGEVTVRIQEGDVICVGRGVSTDILEASAIAYVHAINRLLLEDQAKPKTNGTP
mgnify:FL=1